MNEAQFRAAIGQQIITLFAINNVSPEMTLSVLSDIAASYIKTNETMFDIDAKDGMRDFGQQTIDALNRLVEEKS